MHNLTESKGSAKTTPPTPVQSHAAWLNADHSAELATDLIDQYHGLGMSRREAERLFHAVYAALGVVLAGIDQHALAAVPMPEQVSMLSPRFDIEQLAAATGVDTAQAQTAVAMLLLEFVIHTHLPF